MPKSQFLQVSDLKLDLHNFRTVPQKSESKFLHAVATIGPDAFWALTHSLLEDGYIPTESVIVLEKEPGVYVVVEGNRRVAALKWILGLIRPTNLNAPVDVTDRIAEISQTWKVENGQVPCTIFSAKEAALAEKIVARTHGKGQLAGRDPWLSVAKARHNRDVNHASEPSLDLLEKYLLQGTTATVSQRELWAGDYPLSVLEEALKELAPRVQKVSSREFADAYPKLPHIDGIDQLFREIGMGLVGFPQLRGAGDIFASNYSIPPLAGSVSPTTGKGGTTGTAPAAGTSGRGGAVAGAVGAPGSKKSSGPVALPTTDPRSVMRALRGMAPRGKNREKVATLIQEARALKLKDNPLAFCFLLRSMFEISAKAYCIDHAAAGLKSSDAAGNDRHLIDLLRDATNHMTKNGQDRAAKKRLHGALADLASSAGLLSVTSMNQLVHHPKFTVSPEAVSALFFNVLPLLEELNA